MNDEVTQRARAVKWVIVDVDGVLTDGRTFCGSGGFEGVLFHVHDGTGIKYLRRCGIRAAFMSGRSVEAVLHRARTLGVEEVVQGAKVKLDGYEELRARLGFSDDEACYVGDDLPDLPVMRRVGLAVAVSDARPEVREAAHLVTQAPGGAGAVRELAEFILKAQGKWQEVLRRYEA